MLDAVSEFSYNQFIVGKCTNSRHDDDDDDDEEEEEEEEEVIITAALGSLEER